MDIRRSTWNGRKAWRISNGALALELLEGGGHIASVMPEGEGSVNPLWTPPWRSIDPWQYKRGSAEYGSDSEARLLASIRGHNLCLGHFGGSSADEARAGLGVHGEAPVARWRETARRLTSRSLTLTVACELPVDRMAVRRTLTMSADTAIVRVEEEIENRAARDVPFTLCQHVTFGEPFVERGVTFFDMSATLAHTFPVAFSDKHRMKSDAAFVWPCAPGVRGGTVDVRTYPRGTRPFSDFSTQLMDPSRDTAWFAAVNPKLGQLLGYLWDRADYPWCGNWEECCCRAGLPWGGKCVTRGMEFANTPFPVSLREAVDRGVFQGEKTFRWLPAKGKVITRYAIVSLPVPRTCSAVLNLTDTGKTIEADVAL